MPMPTSKPERGRWKPDLFPIGCGFLIDKLALIGYDRIQRFGVTKAPTPNDDECAKEDDKFHREEDQQPRAVLLMGNRRGREIREGKRAAPSGAFHQRIDEIVEVTPFLDLRVGFGGEPGGKEVDAA